MQDISYLDLTVASLVLLVGLKGILNGFFKEFFGMLGIVGGIFIASEVGPDLGNWINDLLFGFENESAISFTGFVLLLALFWLGMTYIGTLFWKLSKHSGLGPLDKIFGFIFGGGKILIILAVIVYGLSSTKIIYSSLESTFEKSMLYPFLFAVGNVVIQFDPQNVKAKIKQETAEEVDSLLEELKEN